MDFFFENVLIFHKLFCVNLCNGLFSLLQAANQFSSALTSGQIGPVISQFGLSPEVASAAHAGDMQSFFKALENSSNASDSSKSQEDDKKNDKAKDEKDVKEDDDDGMSLD